jgi:hypothetical protein
MAEPITLPRWMDFPPSDKPGRRRAGFRPVTATAIEHALVLLPAGDSFRMSVGEQSAAISRVGALGLLTAAIQDGADPLRTAESVALVNGDVFAVVAPWWDGVVLSVA